MHIEDVGPYSFGERESHFRKSGFGDVISRDSIDYGRHLAAAEMLDEIHTMLFALCKKEGLIKPDR